MKEMLNRQINSYIVSSILAFVIGLTSVKAITENSCCYGRVNLCPPSEADLPASDWGSTSSSRPEMRPVWHS